MGKLTREEGIAILEKAQAEMAKAKTKEDVIGCLRAAGDAVGYAPAMRCLVAGNYPENSTRWGLPR